MCRKITQQKIINNTKIEKNKWEARKKSYSFGFDQCVEFSKVQPRIFTCFCPKLASFC
jgi:hypothetical protein